MPVFGKRKLDRRRGVERIGIVLAQCEFLRCQSDFYFNGGSVCECAVVVDLLDAVRIATGLVGFIDE